MDGASRYRTTRLIGRGGAADVYDAIATSLGGFQRRVVMKRLRRENAADASLARGFIDEARIVSQLHHANIVSVLDFGLADGLPFQVLELVDGLDLAGMVDLTKKTGTPLPIEVALFVAKETAHALSYAHSAEDFEGQPLYIVHRDVTPGNILLSWSGDVKLADFGIARATKRIENTAVGVAKGKLEYMSPEQARADEIDGRADLFSLGCVLHQLVAGSSPLSSLEARREVDMFRDPPLSSQLPDDVRAIVERALRPAPASRFADAETMERELGNALTRRAKSDPRTMLRDLLSVLKAPAKKKTGHDFAELFDVELVMRSPNERRFESRVMSTTPLIRTAGASSSITARPVLGSRSGEAVPPMAASQSRPVSSPPISTTPVSPPPIPQATVVHQLQPVQAIDMQLETVLQQPPTMPSQSSSLPVDDDPLIGMVLDSYRLVDRLGSGGMARVYRAEHLVLGTVVAIKVLHGHASAWSQKRFRREAEAMSRIDHPHVVKIVDFGTTEVGVPFLVMEMLAGKTLKRAIREGGPMSLERSLALGRDLASGLEAIHAHDIIHRDLKPANVMLTGAGAKILDFGIALVNDDGARGETRFTAVQQLLGTPAYMAPEQIESAKEVDERADLYALGALLYFASTGRAPFTGTDREILEAKPKKQPPTLPPSSGLERVVGALLATSPEDRPASAGEVLDRLRAIDIDTTAPLSDHEEDDSEAATPATRVTEVAVPVVSAAIPIDYDADHYPIVQSPTQTAVLQDVSSMRGQLPLPPARARSWIIAFMMLICAALMLAAAARLKEKLDQPAELVVTDLPTIPPSATAKQQIAPEIQPAQDLQAAPAAQEDTEVAEPSAADPDSEKTPGQQNKRTPPSSNVPRLKAKLDAALAQNGVRLEELDPTLVELWQRAVDADNGQAASTALDRLLEKISRAELSEDQLKDRLQKVSRSLKAAADRLSAGAYEPLEARYLDLRASAGEAGDGRARRKLGRALELLERDIARAH